LVPDEPDYLVPDICVEMAAMMVVLFENRKKGYPKSVTDVTELLRLEEKRFVQGVSCFINKIPIFI
jgi:hypothetical protein